MPLRDSRPWSQAAQDLDPSFSLSNGGRASCLQITHGDNTCEVPAQSLAWGFSTRVIFLPAGHLLMSGDIFGYHNLCEGGAAGF